MNNLLYIVTYDLINPGRNYEALHKIINDKQAWAKIGGSSYLVVTTETATQLRDNLKTALDVNDKIYVGLLGNTAAWYGLSDVVSNWIKNNQK